MTCGRATLPGLETAFSADSGALEEVPGNRSWGNSAGIDRETIRIHRESFDSFKRRAMFSLLLGSSGFFLLGVVTGALFF